MLEDTKDYAGELDVTTAAAPVVPVTVDRAERPKPVPAPNKQVSTERILDGKAHITGLVIRPLPGNAITEIRLTDVTEDRKFRVAIETEPRRGRAFRSQGGKGA